MFEQFESRQLLMKRFANKSREKLPFTNIRNGFDCGMFFFLCREGEYAWLDCSPFPYI